MDLARWLARARQYSAAHPSCAALADETYASLSRALAARAPLEYTILRDDAQAWGVPAVDPTVRTRVAPFLHARGARLLRFSAGISKAELATLVDVLLPPPQKIASGGGLAHIARERGVSRVQIDEIDGGVDDAEKQEERRREEMKRFFADAARAVAAGRTPSIARGDLAALLERAEVAAGIVEEEARGGVAEGVAVLALLARAFGGPDAPGEIGRALRALSQSAKERTLLGLPALPFEQRAELVRALAELGDEDLARFALPALRASAGEPTTLLDALGIVVPRDRARLSVARRLARLLCDVPEPEATRLLAELGRPTPEFHSFRAERAVLGDAARRAIAIRRPLAALRSAAARTATKVTVEHGRVFSDLVAASADAPDFAAFCARLPEAARGLEASGDGAATVGLLRGLGATPGAADVGSPAAAALEGILRPENIPELLPALDAAVANADERALAELGVAARRIAIEATELACAHLETTDNRKMRLLLLTALPSAGAALVPLLRKHLKSAKPDVVRTFVQLGVKAGAAPRELMPIARHPDEKVRADVLRALRVMTPDEATLDIVIGYLNDPSRDVRPLARSMFEGEGLVVVGAAAVPRLERIARDEKQDEALRRAALAVLGRGTIDAAAEALFRFMQPDGLLEGGAVTSMRDAAAAALRGSPSEAGKRRFAEGLASSVRRVRRACERAEEAE